MTPRKETMISSKYLNIHPQGFSYKSMNWYKRVIGKHGMMRNSHAQYSSKIRRRGQQRVDKFYTMVVI